ncbi:MAG: acetyl-CoA [Planctomycetota bacterium]|nr:MAG: acetyl-CoA [Planctomycetota bacterium]
MPEDLVILAGARTAMAEYIGTPGGGAFKDVSANELGAHAIKAALERAKVKPEAVEHVVMGNAMQTGADSIYGARHAALKAGIPNAVPALTVNRICGSGIQSIISAGQILLCGEAEIAVAGGMENMSQCPHVIRGMRGQGLRLGQQPAVEDSLMVSLMDGFCGLYMAQTAEKLAKQYGITRQAQDEFAMRSHKEGTRAVQSGIFKEEIVPVALKKGVWDKDDHIKPETSLEQLAALNPAFGKEAKSDGLAPIGRIVSWAVVGVDPSIMGIGPAPAIRKACERAGLKLDQIDLFEINEAFSAQYLAVEKELGLDRAKANVNGGAVAIGHPLAATGTRLVITLLGELKRRGKKFGVASACIGGGQGIAMIVERL